MGIHELKQELIDTGVWFFNDSQMPIVIDIMYTKFSACKLTQKHMYNRITTQVTITDQSASIVYSTKVRI